MTLLVCTYRWRMPLNLCASENFYADCGTDIMLSSFDANEFRLNGFARNSRPGPRRSRILQS